MRPAFAAFGLCAVMLAGCSKSSDEAAPAYDRAAESARMTSVDTTAGAPPAMRAPGIDITAAPGVAFNYRYAFVLPDKAISAVQEQHAAACEKLGPARCRITGMRYTLVDEDRVRGELQFKLDPALARGFGKEGIAAVEKADGTLVDASIEGTDVGSALTASQKRSAQTDAELADIERKLTSGGLTEAEKVELRAQAERLRQQQASERDMRAEGEEMLANTPMTFTYAGDEGFTLGGDPLGDAVDSAGASFMTMVSLVLLVIGTLLPWAVLIALVLFIWRRSPLRHWRRRKTAAAVPAGAETEGKS